MTLTTTTSKDLSLDDHVVVTCYPAFFFSKLRVVVLKSEGK